MLSGYSENAVAATGAANSLLNLFNLITTAVATGASVVISNFIGAERLKKASSAAFSAVITCSLIGLFCSVILLVFSRPLVAFMNLQGAVLEQAILYFRIRVAALMIPSLTSGLSAVMQCYGYPKYTVSVGFISILCNLFFNIYVIHFPKHAPLTGVAGIAAGSVVSQLIALVLILFFFLHVKIKLFCPDSIRELFKLIWKILKIGLPSALSGGSFTFSQVITTSFVATLGTLAVSAKIYYSNIICYAYLFSMSLGNANALLIGRLCGAARYDHAKKLNRQLVKITTVVNFLISLSIVLFRIPLLSFFTQNRAIIQMSLSIVLVDILIEQARAVSQIYEYALRAAGDVAFTMIVTIISCWSCSVGLAYFLSIHCGLGLIGIWIGLAIDETIRAIATFFRWRSNKWIGILKP